MSDISVLINNTVSKIWTILRLQLTGSRHTYLTFTFTSV